MLREPDYYGLAFPKYNVPISTPNTIIKCMNKMMIIGQVFKVLNSSFRETRTPRYQIVSNSSDAATPSVDAKMM